MLLSQYPQISETYMQNELDALRVGHDVSILTIRAADRAAARHDPFELVDRDDLDRMAEHVRAAGARVLHAHWLHMAPLVGRLSARTGLPFTVRTHSFDVLWRDARPAWKRWLGRPAGPAYVRDAMPHLKSERCLGVIAMPWGRPALRLAGLDDARIHDAPPCFAFDRFYDPSPNGEGVMNGGAALPKKSMEDYLALAGRVPELRFSLYPVGYGMDALIAANAASGARVTITPNVEPEAMPAVYKQHRWLVYTASTAIGTSGWPMMVAEAQASGVGVVMKNLRPDLADWVGPGGYLFDTLDDAARIVRGAFPDEKRQLAFEHAKRHDIGRHLHVLTDLWKPALAS